MNLGWLDFRKQIHLRYQFSVPSLKLQHWTFCYCWSPNCLDRSPTKTKKTIFKVPFLQFQLNPRYRAPFFQVHFSFRQIVRRTIFLLSQLHSNVAFRLQNSTTLLILASPCFKWLHVNWRSPLDLMLKLVRLGAAKGTSSNCSLGWIQGTRLQKSCDNCRPHEKTILVVITWCGWFFWWGGASSKPANSGNEVDISRIIKLHVLVSNLGCRVLATILWIYGRIQPSWEQLPISLAVYACIMWTPWWPDTNLLNFGPMWSFETPEKDWPCLLKNFYESII